MRARMLAVLLVIAIASVVGVAYSRLHRWPPMLKCDQRIHNFGEVNPWTHHRHAFVIKNTGGHALRVEKIVSSCTCTRAVLTSNVIGPGQTAKLEVELYVHDDYAPASGRVVLLTNDPKALNAAFTLTARVSPLLNVSPPILDFGEFKSSAITTFPKSLIVVLSRNDDDVQSAVEDVIEPSPLYVERRMSNGRLQFVVKLRQPLPAGPLTGAIAFSLKSNPAVRRTVSVRGHVFGDLRAEPRELNLGLLRGKSPLTHQVEVITDHPVPRQRWAVSVRGTVKGVITARLVEDAEKRFVKVGILPEAFTAERRLFRGVVLVTNGQVNGTVVIPIQFLTIRSEHCAP